MYAVEASRISTVAKAVFEANQLADRITLVPGWSTQIDLPERANVLVSEIIGNEPLGENVLEVTRDAVKRLLTPDARLIPSRLRVMGLAVSIPHDEMAKRTFTEEALRDWQSWYDMSFEPLAKAAQAAPCFFFVKPYQARNWRAFSEPITLADIDFRDTGQLTIKNTIPVIATASGHLNGFLIYFDLQLGSDVWLSSHPLQVESSCSWRVVVWILADSLRVEPGAPLSVTYEYSGVRSNSRIGVASA